MTGGRRQATGRGGLRPGRHGYVLPGIYLCFCGCATLPDPQKASLMQAAEAYNRGDVNGAISRLDPIINEYPKATEIAEAYYIRGLCRLKAGQLAGAAEDFEAAINQSQRE